MDIGFIGLGIVGRPLGLARSAARAVTMVLPGTAVAQQLFSACAAHGGTDRDHSAPVTAIEDLAGVADQC